jgi:hypothetical protein
MGPLLSAVDEFLEGQGWPHEKLPDLDVISFAFQGDHERWVCYVEAQEEHERVVARSVVPYNLPAQRRPAAMEFIARVNYGLVIGNFEMDLEDGEIRFKTGIDVKGTTLTPVLVERFVIPNLYAMNTYLPGLEALVDDASASPAELVAGIES